MLADLSFPAPAWEVIAHAHSWGADAASVEQLSRLPVKDYQGLDEVLRALGQAPGPPPPAESPPARTPPSHGRPTHGRPTHGRPVPALSKAAQHKTVGAGLAVGLLALGVEALTINRLLVESAFDRAWSVWTCSSRFPQVRAGTDRSDIVAILRSSARRKGPHIAIWSTQGEYTPELCCDWPLSRAGSMVGRPAGVTHRQWLELAGALVARLSAGAGEIRYR
jgi:hypothetical protein